MGISRKTEEDYWKNRTISDVYNKAIKWARRHAIPAEELTMLINTRKEAKQELVKIGASMAKQIDKTTNIQELKPGWYAVRAVTPSGELRTSVIPLTSSGVDLVKRSNGERDINSNDIGVLTEGVQSYAVLEGYLKQVESKAKTLLQELFGLNVTIDADKSTTKEDVAEESKELYATNHALERWAERKLGAVDRLNAAEYVRTHRDELEKQVLEAYSKAEMFYEGADATFFIDEHNITYVLCANNIVTLYEQVFGFAPDINRAIAFSQIEVVRHAEQDVSDAYLEYEQVSGDNKSVITDNLNKIRVLEAEIAELRAENKSLDAQNNHVLSTLRKAEETYNAEFNKLFKKFKPL